MPKKAQPNSYTYGEASALDGAVIHFACDPSDREAIVEALSRCFQLDIPTTNRINVPHGGYGRYSRYDIDQLKYAGDGAGFIEALHIKNAPDDRCTYVLHEYLAGRSTFSEWDSADALTNAWENMWPSGRRDRDKESREYPGFVRFVDCGYLNPWFYAVGTEELVGDYTAPQSFSDDPYYRLGQEFLVTEFDPISRQKKLGVLKTCLGCLISEYDTHDYPKRHVLERRVYFHDGTVYLQEDGYGDDFIYAWREKSTSSHFSINPHLVPVN